MVSFNKSAGATGSMPCAPEPVTLDPGTPKSASSPVAKEPTFFTLLPNEATLFDRSNLSLSLPFSPFFPFFPFAPFPFPFFPFFSFFAVLSAFSFSGVRGGATSMVSRCRLLPFLFSSQWRLLVSSTTSSSSSSSSSSPSISGLSCNS